MSDSRQLNKRKRRVLNDTGSRILDMDYKDLIADPNYKSLLAGREEVSNLDSGFSGVHCIWKLRIQRGIDFNCCVYDVEIHFSRHHPFEPPVVLLPRTSTNTCNPIHSSVDALGIYALTY